MSRTYEESIPPSIKFYEEPDCDAFLSAFEGRDASPRRQAAGGRRAHRAHLQRAAVAARESDQKMGKIGSKWAKMDGFGCFGGSRIECRGSWSGRAGADRPSWGSAFPGFFALRRHGDEKRWVGKKCPFGDFYVVIFML